MNKSNQTTNQNNHVADSWANILETTSYSTARDVQYLKRFQASPYIQIITNYANLKPHSLILEPGCGSGKFSLALALQNHRVITFDYVASILHEIRISEQHLSRQLSEDQTAGLITGYCQGDLEILPFADGTFDLTLNEGVVEHWLDDAERLHVFKEMVRITKPGGVVAILVPNGHHPLIKQWDKHLLHKAPPMTYFNAKSLGAEMRLAGLEDIITDGIYPWRSWTRLSPWQHLYLPAAFFDHWVPLPKVIREKWAMNLISLGRKPIS